MSSTDKTLPKDTPTLQNMVLELQSKVNWYEEQFRLLQHKQFGASSEKEPHPDFFNEAKHLQTKQSQKPVKPSPMSVKSPVVSLYPKTCLAKWFAMNWQNQTRYVTAVIICMKSVKRLQSNWKSFQLRFM